MARRNGMPTMLKVAYKLCTLISKYADIIYLQYPSSTALHAALAAAQVACNALRQEIVATIPTGV